MHHDDHDTLRRPPNAPYAGKLTVISRVLLLLCGCLYSEVMPYLDAHLDEEKATFFPDILYRTNPPGLPAKSKTDPPRGLVSAETLPRRVFCFSLLLFPLAFPSCFFSLLLFRFTNHGMAGFGLEHMNLLSKTPATAYRDRCRRRRFYVIDRRRVWIGITIIIQITF